MIRLALPTVAKAALLSIGVPLTIFRLFSITAGTQAGPWWRSPDFFLRLLLLVVALLWVKALWLLARDVRAVLRGMPSAAGNWSSRWAGPLATLALAVLVWNVPVHSSSRRSIAKSAVTAATTGASKGRGLTTPRRIDELPPRQSSGTLGATACLADLAATALGSSVRWPEIAAAEMDRLQGGRSRLVDPSLLRPEWCLIGPQIGSSSRAAAPTPQVVTTAHRNELEEIAWLGLGVLGTAALLRRLRTLREIASSGRSFGDRLPDRDPEAEALESRLRPFADATLIDWIEVANKTLRVVASRCRVSPEVKLVRAGPDGVTFFLARELPCDVAPFELSMDLRALTLPLTESLSTLNARCRDVGRMLPGLIPVGDDGENCWLAAVAPGQQLAIDASLVMTRAVLRGVTTALRTLPWAEELHIELMELAPPPMSEHCYQMTSSSAAAIADLAAARPSPRSTPSTPAWRREPLIITAADVADEVLIPAVMAVAGVIQKGKVGSTVLVVDDRGARLEPHGVELTVPHPDDTASRLIERLLARAATLPSVVSTAQHLRPLSSGPRARHDGAATLRLGLLGGTPRVDGLIGESKPERAERVIEVLSYLHLHGGSVSREALANALFPRSSSSDHLVDDALQATRQAIDAPQAMQLGAQLLSVPFDLDSDWAALSRRALALQYRPREQALKEIPELVAGSSRIEFVRFAWLESEGHIARLRFEICDALHHLATLAIAAREFELAGSSIAEGLRLEPSSELLVRDLMVLRHETEGVAGVTQSYEHLEASLAESGGREPNWTTRALFFELAGRQD